MTLNLRDRAARLLAAVIVAVLTLGLVATPASAAPRGETETRVVFVGPEGRAVEPLQAGAEYGAFIFVLPTDEGYGVCPSPTGTVTLRVAGVDVEELTLENRFAATTLTFTEPGRYRLMVRYSGDENCRRSRYSERWEVA